jgi:hypothetical protein
MFKGAQKPCNVERAFALAVFFTKLRFKFLPIDTIKCRGLGTKRDAFGIFGSFRLFDLKNTIGIVHQLLDKPVVLMLVEILTLLDLSSTGFAR